jgi:hypothetical protein
MIKSEAVDHESLRSLQPAWTQAPSGAVARPVAPVMADPTNKPPTDNQVPLAVIH